MLRRAIHSRVKLSGTMRSMSNRFSPDEAAAVVRALRERRTIGPLRFATGEQPDHELILAAVESARWAPNHKRTEPWRFHLLNEEQIAALADVNAERMRNAGTAEERISLKHKEWNSTPGVMILLCQHAAEHGEILRQENYAACAAAAQNFQLHLFAHGVASKWSTAACWDLPGFWEMLGLDGQPEHSEGVGIFFYGIPDSQPTPMRHLETADILSDNRTQVEAVA